MRQRPMLFATALLCAAVTMVGCEYSANPPAASVAPTVTQAPDAKLQRFYDQDVKWQSCAKESLVVRMSAPLANPKYSCAVLNVPLDYDDPEEKSITLQLARTGPVKSTKPLLFFNPGGPGGGSVASLDYMATSVFSPEVLDHYDLVAMDPRGVGLSSPVRCFTPEQTDKFRASGLLKSVADVEAQAKAMGSLCLERSEGLAKNIDTDSVVKDFDIARAVFGLEKLDYVGFSYGTFIGALYADTFPDRVGRFVLDGAMDPSSSITDIAKGQAAGFEAVVEHWLGEVLSGSDAQRLPLSSDVATAKMQLRQWLDGLETNPLSTSDPDRPLTRGLAASALYGLMYSPQTYQYATTGLIQAMSAEDGSFLLQMADAYANRRVDGSYEDNSFEAFMVINALDYEPVGDPTQWEATARELEEKYPLVGSDFTFSEAGIAGWPVESKKVRRPVTGAGAGPILVVGTTHDPATPYSWAQALAQQLQSATLLTSEGWSHCAYSSAAEDSCVRDAVDDYLLDGAVPEEGLVCQ